MTDTKLDKNADVVSDEQVICKHLFTVYSANGVEWCPKCNFSQEIHWTDLVSLQDPYYQKE